MSVLVLSTREMGGWTTSDAAIVMEVSDDGYEFLKKSQPYQLMKEHPELVVDLLELETLVAFYQWASANRPEVVGDFEAFDRDRMADVHPGL